MFLRVDRLIAIPICVAMISLVLLIQLLPLTNITVDKMMVRSFAFLETVIVGLLAFSAFASYWARDDISPFGRAFAATFRTVRSITLYLALMIPAFVTAGILSYVAVPISGALVDAQLVALDHALGFNWLAFLRFTSGTPYIPAILEFCYHSYYWQFMAMPFVFVAAGQQRALLEFAAASTVAGLATTSISALFPAIGPVAYFQPTDLDFSAYEKIAGGWHLEQYQALRSGAAFMLDKGTGLIAFPSFHTVLAILVCFAARKLPLTLRIPIFVINGILIIGALPVGGHYLVDILAGMAVAAASICATCYFNIPTIKYAASSSRAENQP